MGRRSYNGYHGRATVWDVLRLILALLVLLLVLAAAGLLLGQRYIVYADDGIRLELPFFRREEPPPEVDTSVTLDIVPRAEPSEETYSDEIQESVDISVDIQE